MVFTKGTTLIILAAGASSRMKQSLEKQNALKGFSSKALIPLGKNANPAIDYLICNAQAAGIHHILLVVPKVADAFKSYFQQETSLERYKHIVIQFAIQEVPEGRQKPMGTADAVLQCMEQYPELKRKSFLVCNGDNLYSTEAFADLLQIQKGCALIGYDRDGLAFSMERISAFALLKLDSEKHLLSIIEKPSPEDTKSFQQEDGSLLVSMNLWKFEGATLYPYLKNCPLHPIRNEKELPTAVLNMIKDGKEKVLVLSRNEHVPDLTSAEDIEKVATYLKNQE